jgi:hypothetical protein
MDLTVIMPISPLDAQASRGGWCIIEHYVLALRRRVRRMNIYTEASRVVGRIQQQRMAVRVPCLRLRAFLGMHVECEVPVMGTNRGCGGGRSIPPTIGCGGRP